VAQAYNGGFKLWSEGQAFSGIRERPSFQRQEATVLQAAQYANPGVAFWEKGEVECQKREHAAGGPLSTAGKETPI